MFLLHRCLGFGTPRSIFGVLAGPAQQRQTRRQKYKTSIALQKMALLVQFWPRKWAIAPISLNQRVAGIRGMEAEN